MKRPAQEQEAFEDALDDAKMEFIGEWENGSRPTLQQYVVRYPALAQELAEFILAFVEMELSEHEAVDAAEDSALLARALARAKAAHEGLPPPLNLMDLAMASGIKMPAIQAAISLPKQVVLQIMRGQLADPNAKVIRVFAQALHRKTDEILAAMQTTVAPKAVLSGNYRATGSGKLNVPTLERKTFRQLLEECPELTPEQRAWWLNDNTED